LRSAAASPVCAEAPASGDCRQAQADHALASPHGEVQIGNWPIQQRPLVGREQLGVVSRLFFANLVGELAQFQALRLQHFANFDQRRLAEVLAREELLLAIRVREARWRREETGRRFDRPLGRQHRGNAEMQSLEREGDRVTNVRAIHGRGGGHG